MIRAVALAMSVAVWTIPPDGGVLAFAPLGDFSGHLRLPSSDAAGAKLRLRTFASAPPGVPDPLRLALGREPGARSLVWLEATADAEVHFDPGDTGATFVLRGIGAHRGRDYFAAVCDDANCKPHVYGPLFRDGDELIATNARTPFHFHFVARRDHDYVVVIFARPCLRGECS